MRGILSELTLTEVVQTIGTGGVATSIFNQPRGGRMFFHRPINPRSGASIHPKDLPASLEVVQYRFQL